MSMKHAPLKVVFSYYTHKEFYSQHEANLSMVASKASDNRYDASWVLNSQWVRIVFPLVDRHFLVDA